MYYYHNNQGMQPWMPYFPGYRAQAQQPIVVSNAYGDVNGDGVVDHVYLTAVKSAEQGSPYREQITLMIQDGASGKVYSVPLDADGNSGYNPTLFLGDFTGDAVQDILVRIDSGGSGAFTFDYVFSFLNNQARKLFDYNQYNQQNQYQVEYLDGYKVRVVSPASGQFYIIDISGRDADYLSQIYDANGKLKKPVQGSANGVSSLQPVDLDRDGVYELQAYQRLTGLYDADSLGYVINTLQWNGQQFVIWQQWVGILGNDVK